MDISRAKDAADVIKMTTKLGKNIRKPSVSTPLSDESGAVLVAVEGSGFVRVLMYLVAGLLLIGLVLLGVDQWITPIFQRVPGGKGYIPIPGTDMSQVYWKTPNTVADIIIGTPPVPVTTPGAPAQVPPLSTTVIEGQSSYSITMDVFIDDEYPQSLGLEDRRIFFLIGQTPNTPSLYAWIANNKNTAYITCFDADGLQESAEIENVPIHKPFRIGIVKTAYALEAYLDGLLVMTRPIKSASKVPTTGDKIFSPANITINGKVLSQKIKVLNVRTFGYIVQPSEMKGRMSDLVLTKVINPSVAL